jgi:ankyrin repeat protein
VSLPTRTLASHADLAQLKRQAKELVKDFAAGDASAAAEIAAHYRGADPKSFALPDAQLVLARAYGFRSWPALKAFVDGVTVRRLVEAIRAGDAATVRAMAARRPEIVNLDVAENDEHQALHHAVLTRQPDLVRLLMQLGAEPRKGIYPHRHATTALALATERGYDEIVAIILEEERTRPRSPMAAVLEQDVPALNAAVEQNDEPAIIAALDAHPGLVNATDPRGRTALHWAAARAWERVTSWLLDHGAAVNARAKNGETPLDLVACDVEPSSPDRSRLSTRLAELLLGRGATRTVKWAVTSGDAAWLRARHHEGGLTDAKDLVSHAVRSGREDMLRLVLELGFDPDESGVLHGVEEVVPTWGGPLRECAIGGHVALAEILLAHRANPNTNVYAASSALYEAQVRGHAAIVSLLEAHGARHTPTFVADLGLVEQAAHLLAEDAAGRTPAGFAAPGSTVAEDLLWGAMGNASPAIVELALERIGWPPEDRRWYRFLENGMYSPVRSENFRRVLSRSHPDMTGPWNATLLHQIAASRGGLSAEERLTLATMVLDAGARLDLRDTVLQSTPLGWACRWGRIELVRLFLNRGADPIEAGAEPWARPLAWAEKMNRRDVVETLRQGGPRVP